MSSSLITVISADHMQLASLPENEQFLPDEIIFEIFSHLNLQELANCPLIASRFITKIDDLLLKKILQHMTPFGKEEWETFFGEVGVAPPLPPLKVFKEIYKTYMLVLLPKTVDGKPFTFNFFRTLAANPKGGGNVTKINIRDSLVKRYGSLPNVCSRWVLFPKILLEDSIGKSYAEQIQMVAAKGEDYKVTRLLEAVVSLVSRHVQSGERLFSGCFTRCQEKIYSDPYDYQLIVGYNGGRGPDGWIVEEDIFFNMFYGGSYGVAAVRKCPLSNFLINR